MIRELLPIGSVVLLKEAVKPVMIFGIKQVDIENQSQEYDYIAVLYPEGNIGEKFQYMFNHSDIDKILYRGYDSEELQEFLNKIAKAYGE